MENLHIVEVRPIKTIIYSSHCHVECHRVCKYKYYIIYIYIHMYIYIYVYIYIHIHTLDYNNHTSCEPQHEQWYLATCKIPPLTKPIIPDSWNTGKRWSLLPSHGRLLVEFFLMVDSAWVSRVGVPLVIIQILGFSRSQKPSSELLGSPMTMDTSILTIVNHQPLPSLTIHHPASQWGYPMTSWTPPCHLSN